MTCGEVSKHLDGADTRRWGGLPAQVREHLEQCGPCQALWDFLTRQDTAQLEPELLSQVSRTVQQSLEPVKPLPSARLLTLGFLLIFGVISAGFVGISGLRGADAMGNMTFAGMLGIIGAAAFLVAFTLSREMAPGEKKILSAPRLFLLLLMPLFLAASVLFPWDFSRNIRVRQLEMFPARLPVFPAGGWTRRDASAARSGSILRRCRRRRGLAGWTRRCRRAAFCVRHEQCRARRSRPSRDTAGGSGGWRRDRAPAARHAALAPCGRSEHLTSKANNPTVLELPQESSAGIVSR